MYVFNSTIITVDGSKYNKSQPLVEVFSVSMLYEQLSSLLDLRVSSAWPMTPHGLKCRVGRSCVCANRLRDGITIDTKTNKIQQCI